MYRFLCCHETPVENIWISFNIFSFYNSSKCDQVYIYGVHAWDYHSWYKLSEKIGNFHSLYRLFLSINGWAPSLTKKWYVNLCISCKIHQLWKIGQNFSVIVVCCQSVLAWNSTSTERRGMLIVDTCVVNAILKALSICQHSAFFKLCWSYYWRGFFAVYETFEVKGQGRAIWGHTCSAVIRKKGV